MAYVHTLKCSNCNHTFNSGSIAGGTTVATYLTTPASNADCPNCGCNTLQTT